MTIYELVITECGKRGVSASKAMEEMGLNKSSLSHWKDGMHVPSDIALAKLADYFGISFEELSAARVESMTRREVKPRKKKVQPVGGTVKAQVPLLGTIACGNPILAYENVSAMIPVPPMVHADFALQCEGESMINARIFPGDIVYIRKQPVVENGEIAAVLIGDEATLKRVFVSDSRLTLMPENPMFESMNYVGEEMNQVQILGKAVAVTNFLNGERGSGK